MVESIRIADVDEASGGMSHRNDVILFIAMVKQEITQTFSNFHKL